MDQVNETLTVEAHPSMIRRRSVLKGAAWAVPAVTVLAAAPASAQSPCPSGSDTVLSLCKSVPTSAGWVNPDAVKGVDGVATTHVAGDDAPGTTEIGSPLVVSSFEIPQYWNHLKHVVSVGVNVRNSVSSLTTGAKLDVTIDYRDGGAALTRTDDPTTDQIHTFSFSLDPTRFSSAPMDTLNAMTVTLAPKANEETTFSVESVYLLITYLWEDCPTGA